MAEQRLDASEIGSIVEEVGGEGVTQFVGAECRGQSRLADILLEQEPDGAVTEALAAFI
jgi:hypothetical protein